MRLKAMFYRLMAAADDNGSSGVVDRGDDFVPAEPAPAVAPAAAEPAPAPAPAADDTQPRGEDGKFAPKPKDDGPVIPKARFDEQLGKERAAREAAERRAEAAEAAARRDAQNVDINKAVADVAELRKSERKALLDGDEEKAASLSAQADALNRQIAIAQAGQTTSETKDQALEDMRFELTVERLEETYPALRTGSDEYDADLVYDVLDKQAGLIQREGLSPSKALAKAAKQIMERRVATPAADTGAAAPAAEGLREQRKADAVAKNIEAAARQPGSTRDVGMNSDKAGQTGTTPAATSMTQKEFDALSDDVRAQMRGDFTS